MPWCTYTDPEIAHVGTLRARRRGAGHRDRHLPCRSPRRTAPSTDGEDEGFVKVHVRKGTDEIVGATIVAAHAGEMISELTLAMTQGIGLGAFTSVIHPYPTQAEAIKAVAGLYTRTRLTPLLKRLFGAWLRLSR